MINGLVLASHSLEHLESLLLHTLPWSFTFMSLALCVMWWHLAFRTNTRGELGHRINISFRDMTIMSLFLTWLMIILAIEIDASEIRWPVTTLMLLGLALYPYRVAWSQFRVWWKYRHMHKSPELNHSASEDR